MDLVASGLDRGCEEDDLGEAASVSQPPPDVVTETAEGDARWRTPGLRRTDGAISGFELRAGDDERGHSQEHEQSGEEAAVHGRDLLP